MTAHSKFYEPRMTLAEVGAELGITPERARQIEKRALHKLRVALVVRGHGKGMLDSYAPENVLEAFNSVSVVAP